MSPHSTTGSFKTSKICTCIVVTSGAPSPYCNTARFAPHVGLKLIDAHDDFVGYGEDESYRLYVHTGKPAISGLHLCFEAGSRDGVAAFYKAALDACGSDNGAPGIREKYSPSYYAAFVLDPDGNNIETVCHKG